eukprot:m.357957 g.357957  ORF g.357957 m.357957 type:complete len:425 (+) comp17994_c0_seq1:319-1593(+)
MTSTPSSSYSFQSNPRHFPGMAALFTLANKQKSLTDTLKQFGKSIQKERDTRVSNLLTAEWAPSSNANFELLTGRVQQYTYYIYCRTNRVPSPDLCGGFVAFYPEDSDMYTRTARDVQLMVPLEKDMAVYAWDLASLITQASYCLTFLAHVGFPNALVIPLQRSIESTLVFKDLTPTQLPRLEYISRKISHSTFEAGKVVYKILCGEKALALSEGRSTKLCAEEFLAIQEVQEDGPTFLKQSPEAVIEIAAKPIDELPAHITWDDLDDALAELFEHFMLCGLSFISYLRMPHKLYSLPDMTVYTRLSISQVRLRSDGVLIPPPVSQSLQKLIEDNGDFKEVVRHPHLDNEHLVSPESLHTYIRNTPVQVLFTEMTSTIDVFYDAADEQPEVEVTTPEGADAQVPAEPAAATAPMASPKEVASSA